MNTKDAINIEVEPSVVDDICEILKKAFYTTSSKLNLVYPVTGNPNVGKNQWETH